MLGAPFVPYNQCMTLWGNLLRPSVQRGHDEPGLEGVCPSCGHTPTPTPAPNWIDRLVNYQEPRRTCTALDDGQNPTGHPDSCGCLHTFHAA